MKVQWKHAIHLNTQQLLYEQSDFSMQWSSGHHPNCSWIRFLKHFVIYLIEVVDVFRCVQNIFICSPVRWKKLSVSTGDPQPVSSQASCIDRGKARAERVVSIAFQSYSKEWYHWSSSARAVPWLYFWCWLTHSLDSCSLVEGGSLSYFHGVYICILSAGFQSSTISYHWQNPGKSLSIPQVLEAASLLKAAKRKGCIQLQYFKLCKSTLQGACFVPFMFYQCNNNLTYSQNHSDGSRSTYVHLCFFFT